MKRILTFPRPVITACTGHGIAAGGFIQLTSDLRLGVDGPFQIGLNEVTIGLTMPQFVIELARSRLSPAHFDRAINSAAMYTPADAVGAGFLDRVVTSTELRQASLEAARELAGLNREAHTATKLKSAWPSSLPSVPQSSLSSRAVLYRRWGAWLRRCGGWSGGQDAWRVAVRGA